MHGTSTSRTVAELRAQHVLLRGIIDRCEALADRVETDSCGPLQLTREVARLRLAFDAHSRFEDQLIEAGLVGQELARHTDGRRAMRMQLATTNPQRLRHVLAAMRVHLDLEERYLTSTAEVRVPA